MAGALMNNGEEMRSNTNCFLKIHFRRQFQPKAEIRLESFPFPLPLAPLKPSEDICEKPCLEFMNTPWHRELNRNLTLHEACGNHQLVSSSARQEMEIREVI